MGFGMARSPIFRVGGLIAATATLSLIGTTAGAATMSDPVVSPAVQQEANEIALKVSTLVPDELETDDQAAQRTGSTFSAGSSLSTAVSIPGTAGGSATATRGGTTVGAGLGTATATSGVLAEDGSVVYNATGSVDRSVQATIDGFRIHTVMNSSLAPTSFVHPVAMPTGARLAFPADLPREPEDPGALDPGAENIVLVLSASGDLLGGFGLPWAKDANGASVPTRFEIQGSNIVQVVEHRTSGVVYPVVADPYFGRAMISSASWEFHSGYGWTLRVAPTAWARAFAGAYLAGVYGWRELYDKYRNQGLNTNLGGMRDQWICHQQVVAIRTPRKATWNLDEWRADVTYLQTVNARCNPGGAVIWD
jgi:hypothetical protein